MVVYERTAALPEAAALREMTDRDENTPYMQALRAFEKERQEEFAAEVGPPGARLESESLTAFQLASWAAAHSDNVLR